MPLSLVTQQEGEARPDGWTRGGAGRRSWWPARRRLMWPRTQGRCAPGCRTNPAADGGPSNAGTVKAWFQVQRRRWQHGCEDPHKCRERHHRYRCKKRCPLHQHDPGCPANCTKRGHACPKRVCPKDCTGHAAMCSRRQAGGFVFRQRKGRRKLTLQCPPELLPILRAHRTAQTGRSGRRSFARLTYVTPARMTPGTRREPSWWSKVCISASYKRFSGTPGYDNGALHARTRHLRSATRPSGWGLLSGVTADRLQPGLQPSPCIRVKALHQDIPGRGFDLRRLGDLNPGWA